jgi:RNA polymerase sigma-70 factor (ECF subfamily)
MNQHTPVYLDAELIDQARLGDKHAFDQLVQKYQFKILKLVNRYVKDPSEAMDVTQESFIKAYRAIHRFRGESAFYTWLYRIAINTAKNHAIMQSRRLIEMNIEVIDMDQSLAKMNLKDYSAPEKILLDVEIEDVINEVIQHLPKELKTAVTLRDLEGKSYDEISGIMGCPVGTVRSRIFRAREAIERRIRHLLD